MSKKFTPIEEDCPTCDGTGQKPSEVYKKGLDYSSNKLKALLRTKHPDCDLVEEVIDRWESCVRYIGDLEADNESWRCRVHRLEREDKAARQIIQEFKKEKEIREMVEFYRKEEEQGE